jgi:hypothetical protein
VKNEVENLFQQEMNRKEFLQYVGSALLLVLGAGSLLKALKIGQKPGEKSTSGYGASLYGGPKR